MAKVTPEVIGALRATAKKLASSPSYQWGHMGLCNCGFLAQQITQLSKEEIHRRAMLRHGDWNEQLNDYCEASGLPMDDMISELIAFGFDSDDLKHLERLSAQTILLTLPADERNLCHNVKADVLKYLNAWITVLETELLSHIQLESIETPAEALSI